MSNASQQEKEKELASLLADMVQQYGHDMPPEPTPVHVTVDEVPVAADEIPEFTLQDEQDIAAGLDTAELSLADIPAPDWGEKPHLSLPSADELAQLDAVSVPVAAPRTARVDAEPEFEVLEFVPPEQPVAAPKVAASVEMVVQDAVKMETPSPAIVVKPTVVETDRPQAVMPVAAEPAAVQVAELEAEQVAEIPAAVQVAAAEVEQVAEAPAAPTVPEIPAITVPDLPEIVVPAAAAAVSAAPQAESEKVAAETKPSNAVEPAAGEEKKQAAASEETVNKAAETAPKPPKQPESLLRERAKLHPLLEKMADEALKRNASDIFISSNFPPAFKIDGTLVPVPLKPLTPEEAAQIVYSTFTSDLAEAFPKELELNYSVEASNGIRFRVNAYHEQGRISLVMRRITTEILTVDDLMLPQSLKELVMRKRGLLILAGATGSGKSTSMAAMLDWRNKQSAGHIVTIEDPIEYIHKPIKSIITQREVGMDTHSWGNAVHSAMRQAPDVVCVGEVRNEHAMEYALQLAQTGHLCIFTIHASNASQTIERIMNLYPEERHPQVLMDLALNLVGIIGQRLVVKKGGKGRRAIVDLLINTPAMQDHVFKNELMEARDLMERAEGDGMQTFDQDLFRLYIEGVIDYDEALRQAESANDLRLRIKLYEEGQESTHIFERVGDLNLM